MQAGMYARELIVALGNGQSEHYTRLLGLADLECRMLARYPKRWESLSVEKRMMKAFRKWEAIYRAVHSGLGDQRPPTPLVYSGPYLIILKNLVIEKDKDRHFPTKLAMLGRHAVDCQAARCDVFDLMYREHMSIGERTQDATELQRAKNSLDKLYTKYIRCIGPFVV